MYESKSCVHSVPVRISPVAVRLRSSAGIGTDLLPSLKGCARLAQKALSNFKELAALAKASRRWLAEAAASVFGLSSSWRSSVLLRDGESGGDVREVTQPLREVAEQLVMLSIVFLREEAEIVPRGDGPVEYAPRLVEAILTCQALE